MHATWRNETQNEYVMREKEREASYYTFLHTNAFDKRTYIHTYIPNESWGQVSGGSECESKFTWLVLLLTNRVLDCSTCSRNFHVSYIPLSLTQTYTNTHIQYWKLVTKKTHFDHRTCFGYIKGIELHIKQHTSARVQTVRNVLKNYCHAVT